MSYLVLARKYRPQTFEAVVGQQHVTRTLANAIVSNRVAHAILFSGPRGTGKTTVARILAKALNCELGPAPVPCNQCRSCLEITSGHAADVFEIDGASNNSVDQVRELRENIRYLPAHSRYKIYIIDEVHMLSIAAFNALLKTLEEPPEHVLFFFATTEAHKIPITILSRCQRHDMRRITAAAICQHLQQLCQKEGVAVDDACLWMIAREANGGLRDALSLLDQIMASDATKITLEQTAELLGVVDRQMLADLSAALLGVDIARALTIIDDCYRMGRGLRKLYGDLLEYFRNLLVVKLGKNVETLVDLPVYELDQMKLQVKAVSAFRINQLFHHLFGQEVAVRLAVQPKLAMETVMLGLLELPPALSVDTLIQKLDALYQKTGPVHGAMEMRPESVALPDADRLPVTPPETAVACPVCPPESLVANPEASSDPALGAECTWDAAQDLERTWKGICDQIARRYPSLAPCMGGSHLNTLSDKRIVIGVAGNAFNIERIKRKQNLERIQEVCRKFLKKPVSVEVVATQAPEAEDKGSEPDIQQLKQQAMNHPLVADAIDVFNAELIDIKIL
jgi:DNA polymerase-3 subunit gamma/tau